jgi:cytochrome P450
MTSARPGRLAAGPPPEHLSDDVWRVTDLGQARGVCGDDQTFRAAAPNEFVSGISRSFFLATDTASPADRARFRNALAAALAPRRLQRLTEEVLKPVAHRLARQLPLGRPLDLMEAFVRPYTRQVAYRLAGLPETLGIELAAFIKVAADMVMRDEQPNVVRELLAHVWTSIADAVGAGDLASDSLPGFALTQGSIREEEIPLLLVPILEMAVLDLSSALTTAAVARMSRFGGHAQLGLQRETAARDLVWVAAADLVGLNITRVATEATIVGGVSLPPSSRLILDVTAANRQVCSHAAPGEGLTGDGDHLAFGQGAHACMGRGLALAVAATAIRELAGRGRLSQAASTQHDYRLEAVT